MTFDVELAPDWWSRMHGPDAEQHRAAFERWLAADPRNRQAYQMLEGAWQEAAMAGETKFAKDRALGRHRPPFGITVPRVAALAAAAAAILLVVVLRPAAQNPVRPPVETAQLLQTALGEIRTIDLPDGSKVTLDTDSQVRVSFAAEVRRVELVRGRARFEVRADPSRMFVVEAGDRQVSAPEGSFDAALQPNGVCVSAWRGSLDIRDRGATITSAALFRLAPGQSIALPPGQGLPPRSRPAGTDTGQWPAGMLVFHSTPLSDVLAETNRYSRRRIALGDPSLGELRVTGTFRPLPVDALAASLAAAFDLRVGSDASGNIVLQQP
jgi:transmembrane sensor